MLTSGVQICLPSISDAVMAGFARAVTGVRPIWDGCAPGGGQRIYFANHSSHGDFIVISACLPPAERRRTSAVAGAEYWTAGPIRRFIAQRLMRTVLVERDRAARTVDPLAAMLDALDQGQSLILFPEGTRNMTDAPLLPFRAGLFHLLMARPGVEAVPCWIENMSRVLPKGAVLPVPLLCRVIFGAPVTLDGAEDKAVFLERARNALRALDPAQTGEPR